MKRAVLASLGTRTPPLRTDPRHTRPSPWPRASPRLCGNPPAGSRPVRAPPCRGRLPRRLQRVDHRRDHAGVRAPRDSHRDAVNLQFDSRGRSAPSSSLARLCSGECRIRFRLDHCRHEHRRERTLGGASRRLRRVPQLAPPGEQLRRPQVVPTRQIADVVAPGHLGNQCQLVLG